METKIAKKYRVRVFRTETRCHLFDVEATSQAEAREVALDEAGVYDFHDGSFIDAEYSTSDDVIELEDGEQK